MPRLSDAEFCWSHEPSKGRARALARAKGGRNRQTPRGAAPPTEPPTLRTVDAIQRQLESAVFDTLHQENSEQRSRVIGYLLSIGLRCLEVGELEERIAALEAIIQTGPRRMA
jgi:uncharacterized small protein (DUF1192 family)